MTSAGQTEHTAETGSEYQIRHFEPGDREPFLELYETVFGSQATGEWFDWKYRETPAVDHVPMVVAEYDGEIVGTRPYMAVELDTGHRSLLGIQTCETMVHPDHRRNGLFTRMTDESFDFYEDREKPVLMFSIPNAISRPGYLSLDCAVVGQLPIDYRIQQLDSMVGDGTTERVASAVQPAVSLYNAARDRITAPTPDPTIDITCHDEPPVGLLTEQYERAVPTRIHAARTEAFYQWRFANPNWSYRAYSASRDGDSIATIVVGEQRSGGTTQVRLTEVVPLLGGDRRRPALTALVSRILSDVAEADLVAASGGAIPRDLLTSFGFHGDDRLPLSRVTTPTVLITKLLDGQTDSQWLLDGHDLQDPTSWQLSFSEHNTS